MGYVLPARVRGITHGVVLCAIASNAIACTPAGIDQESIPYWIFTILWVSHLVCNFGDRSQTYQTMWTIHSKP